MEWSRPCSSCGQRALITDDITGNLVCSSCGVVQEYDNFQHSFIGINGPTGTFVRTGTSGSGNVYSYKETKIYKAKQTIDHITSLLEFSDWKKDDVRVMVETVTKGEYGQGDWFPVLTGACAYIVMRKDNNSLLLSEVADKVNCELYELGRMVNRVVDFLELKLPEFSIVSVFERGIQTCFRGVSEEKFGRMQKQGTFLVQCMVKWYLTTGRRPLQVVVAVLVFVAQLNDVDARIDDIASELRVAVSTCRLRYKELLESLVKVGQALPWGKDITVKNIVKNAPFVVQYMELKSMAKRGEGSIGTELVRFELGNLVSDCLRKEECYGIDIYDTTNDSRYFEVEDRSLSLTWSIDDLEELKISPECLSKIYSEMSNEANANLGVESAIIDGRRKRGRVLNLSECMEWWRGKSELSKKLFLKQILEKDVGLSAVPPSFTDGCLAYQRRREKIKAAKQRIDKIMCPSKLDFGSGNEIPVQPIESKRIGNKRKRAVVGVDWEDLIIEALLLHQVKEEEIEKGHYNTLVDLHVFNSGCI